MTTPLLTLSQVTKEFGAVSAVWQVNLKVHSGDFIALFGPNGAGKTTLIRVVARLTTPSSGRVDYEQAEDRRSKARVGYVSHQSLLYNELTGRENLLFFARLYSLVDPRTRAEELLAQVALSEAADQLVRTYSRGMKQRLTLARAVLHEPDILLLDEPYSGLDQHGSRLLTQVLQELKEEKRTVLLITHSLSEGLVLCNRVMVMHRGEVIFDAPREHIDEENFESLYFRMVDR